MVLKKDKKGQAAIEFLMTYGWMLLVVLIVGALIFSFVDFGSLLPNKIDLSNNLKGDPTRSVAYNNADVTNPNLVKVVFKFNGAKRTLIGITTTNMIATELGDQCNMTVIENLDTSTSTSTMGNTVPFLNGQEGLATFNCSAITGGLLPGDGLAGSITIHTKDPKTNLEVPSSGPIRLGINK